MVYPRAKRCLVVLLPAPRRNERSVYWGFVAMRSLKLEAFARILLAPVGDAYSRRNNKVLARVLVHRDRSQLVPLMVRNTSLTESR